MKEERQKREQKGRDAEDQVAAFLEAEGYAVVARRLRTPAGEIDLAAYREPVLAFVEVKAGKSVGQGLYSLSERQAARIAGAAEFSWLRTWNMLRRLCGWIWWLSCREWSRCTFPMLGRLMGKGALVWL